MVAQFSSTAPIFRTHNSLFKGPEPAPKARGLSSKFVPGGAGSPRPRAPRELLRWGCVVTFVCL